MKAELKLKRVVIAGLLLSAPLTVLAGGGQAFKDQKAHAATNAAQQDVRNWAAIDTNGDHLISAGEMESFLNKQHGKQEAATGSEPQANLNQAEKLYAAMMYSTGIKPQAVAALPPDNSQQWNQVEKLYWSLQPSEDGGFKTAGAGKFQWQLDDATQEALTTAANERVLDSTALGMHFKHGAGRHQQGNRIYLPGVTYTVEIPSTGKHQTTTLPDNLVELEPASDAKGG